MVGTMNMLAAGDWVGFLVAVVIAILVGISRLADKAAKAKAEQRVEELRRQRQEQERQAAGQPPQRPQGQQHQAPAQQSRPGQSQYNQPMRQAPARPVAMAPPPVIPPVRQAQQVRRPAPVIVETADGQQRVVVLSPEEQVHEARVADELAFQERRRELVDQQRAQRMAEASPEEADTDRITARLVHVRPSTLAPVETAVALAEVDLSDPQAARLAMIYHEVFSAPKALRQEAELWQSS